MGRGAIAILVLCFCIASNIAYADTSEAERLEREAFEAFAESDFETAIERFKQSYKLEPKASILFNLAVAYIDNGQLPKAAPVLEKFLLNPEGADDRYLEMARKHLKTIDTKVAKVTVRCELQGTILIDGDEVGKSPGTRKVRVMPGDHTLSLRGGPDELESIEFTAKPGDELQYDLSLPSRGKRQGLVFHLRSDVSPLPSKFGQISAIGVGYNLHPLASPYASFMLGGLVSTDAKWGFEAGMRARIGGTFAAQLDVAGHALFIDGTNFGVRAVAGVVVSFGAFDLEAGAGFSTLSGGQGNTFLVPVGLRWNL